MIYMFLAAALGITQDVGIKIYALKFGNLKNSSFLLTAIASMMACIIRAIIEPVIILPIEMMIYAVLCGVLGMVAILPAIKALNTGPVVSVNLVVQCMSYIPIAYGIIVYGDEVKILSIIAAVIFLGVLLLLSPKNKEKQKSNGKWFFYAVLAGVLNAIFACVQKTVSQVGNSGYMEGFIFWQTLFISLSAFIAFLSSKKQDKKELFTCLKKEKSSAITAVLVYGLCNGFVVFSQLKALSTVSTLIVYPTLWGLSLIITPIISVIYFKDLKLTWRNILAIVLGLIATMFNVFA